jgi:hypothetical protein
MLLIHGSFMWWWWWALFMWFIVDWSKLFFFILNKLHVIEVYADPKPLMNDKNNANSQPKKPNSFCKYNVHKCSHSNSCYSKQLGGWSRCFRTVAVDGCTCDNVFLLPQDNGCACVDFGCTHPIDGLFWSLPIYLLGFFSKYECWITDVICLYIIVFFLVVTCLFVSQGFISLWNVKNNSYD